MCTISRTFSIHIRRSSLLRLHYLFLIECYYLSFLFTAQHYAASHVACRSTVVVYNAFRVSLGLLRLGQTKSESFT